MTGYFKVQLFVAMLAPVICCSQDSLVHDDRRMIVYAELMGNNYFSYTEDFKAVSSLNIGYRLPIFDFLHCVTSVGFGVFREEYFIQIPYQPATAHKSVIAIIPLEVSLQVGRHSHCVEFGFGYVQAFGEHRIPYIGSLGSAGIRVLEQGHQYVVRLSYVYYARFGMFVRVAITPHFYDSNLNMYENKRMYKADWLPLGLSLGYSF